MNYRWGGQWSRKRIFMAKNRPKMTQILVWDWNLDLKQWKCDARTISDARGSNDARGTPLIPTTHPRFASARPVVPPRGRPPFPSSLFLGYLNLGQCTGQPFERSVWLTDHTLLHSLLGAMVNWKNCTTLLVCKMALWPVDTIEWYQMVAMLKSNKFNPLTFFPWGPRFRDLWQWSLDRQRHLVILLHNFIHFIKVPEKGVKFLELLRCKLTRGPKWRCFWKHLASLHQKIKKWPKTGGVFWKLF